MTNVVAADATSDPPDEEAAPLREVDRRVPPAEDDDATDTKDGGAAAAPASANERRETIVSNERSGTSTAFARPVKRKEKNELTHLLPGYTAPLRLHGADSTAPARTLADVARQATLQQKSIAMRMATGNNGATAAAVSFKTGRQPRAARAAAVTATAGANWFHMRPSLTTEAVRHDLAVIRNRNYLDPKRFYKSADKSVHAKNGTTSMVQVGTVVEGAAEFYSSRLTNAQRRTNLTDEILADAHLSGYAQGKFKKMQQAKTAAFKKRGGGKKPRR